MRPPPPHTHTQPDPTQPNPTQPNPTTPFRPERAVAEAAVDYFLSVNTVPTAERHAQLGPPLYAQLLPHVLRQVRGGRPRPALAANSRVWCATLARRVVAQIATAHHATPSPPLPAPWGWWPLHTPSRWAGACYALVRRAVVCDGRKDGCGCASAGPQVSYPAAFTSWGECADEDEEAFYR